MVHVLFPQYDMHVEQFIPQLFFPFLEFRTMTAIARITRTRTINATISVHIHKLHYKSIYHINTKTTIASIFRFYLDFFSLL